MAKRKPRIDHSEIVRQFAVRLRELRISRGLTQTELATAARVTPTYVGRLEAAQAAPGIDLVARLAEALGAAVSELLPTSAEPDALGALKTQARKLFSELLENADKETLMFVNPLLLRLVGPNSGR